MTVNGLFCDRISWRMYGAGIVVRNVAIFTPQTPAERHIDREIEAATTRRTGFMHHAVELLILIYFDACAKGAAGHTFSDDSRPERLRTPSSQS
ncbi:hypothetical protein J2S43_001734 [Catenuloplanes nepalensis]|uniref:Uncharacterized protein n=1 Tax=Catenuloplanes nepalensis TaxID=587533 RepID=A0ABT9MP65_9ACTN|nr:hypothetical protein [Catenuloplanes nepalensis]MDP9793222.1 hypothetical protein [Catenuloplanes nepalensis]